MKIIKATHAVRLRGVLVSALAVGTVLSETAASAESLAIQEERAEPSAPLGSVPATGLGQKGGLLLPAVADNVWLPTLHGYSTSEGAIFQGRPIILAAQQNPTQNPPPAGTLPTTPVGEAPESAEMMEIVNALPEGARVLTPTGGFVIENSIEYARTSSNRLVFRGVEIVPGIQLGLIDANDVARDTVIGAFDLRYGIFDRVEIEARVPFVYRHDRLTVLSQQVSPTVPAATQTTILEGRDLGDVEFGLRYQLNRGVQGGPIYVGGIRVKTRTGLGPFDVDFDSTGVATELGTGSGFWAVEPTVTMLFPSDPVVIYFNVGYLHNFKRDINKNIGTTPVGEVSPGDAIPFSMGFGFALNPQFSFSLGFSNTYIFETRTELGTIVTRSDALEAASLTMGMSYIFSPTLTLSSNFEFGVTSDAPDMRVVFRVPFRF